MNSILLVDSEVVVATALQTTLRRFGLDVDLAASYEAAHERLQMQTFDLILVEFDLSSRPNEKSTFELSQCGKESWSGPGLVRELRATGVSCPILVYTAHDADLYETASLDAGADDYIIKKGPVSTLLSRLHAHLRRSERDLGFVAKAERRVAIGRFMLDRKAKILLADEKGIKLAQREMLLLEKLASSPSRIFSSDEILNFVYGDHVRRSLPALSSLLRRLRQKMAANDLPDLVENVRGRGFRLLQSISFHARRGII